MPLATRPSEAPSQASPSLAPSPLDPFIHKADPLTPAHSKRPKCYQPRNQRKPKKRKPSPQFQLPSIPRTVIHKVSQSASLRTNLARFAKRSAKSIRSSLYARITSGSSQGPVGMLLAVSLPKNDVCQVTLACKLKSTQASNL